jgi:hypothetical protein
MPPHRLAERNLVRITNFVGSRGIGKHPYCVSTNHQPYASRRLNRTLLDNGLVCLEGTSIAEATRRFDCPVFPLSPPKTVQTKRLDREHLNGSALNARPQPRFTSPAAPDPSARSVPLRLRVRRSVHGHNRTSNCWNQGGDVYWCVDEINPLKCPLCGQPNHCAISEGADDCWCRHIQIPIRHLMRIPPTHIGKACVCQMCAAAPLQINSAKTPALAQLFRR